MFTLPRLYIVEIFGLREIQCMSNQLPTDGSLQWIICMHFQTSIKLCDASQGSVGAAATSQVLPCLLKAGLGSQLQECRAISSVSLRSPTSPLMPYAPSLHFSFCFCLRLATIVKISKTAGKLLQPHIPLLVTALLEALSTLEPQYLNYLSLHATMSSEVTQDKVDPSLISCSSSST